MRLSNQIQTNLIRKIQCRNIANGWWILIFESHLSLLVVRFFFSLLFVASFLFSNFVSITFCVENCCWYFVVCKKILKRVSCINRTAGIEYRQSIMTVAIVFYIHKTWSRLYIAHRIVFAKVYTGKHTHTALTLGLGHYYQQPTDNDHISKCKYSEWAPNDRSERESVWRRIARSTFRNDGACIL